MENKINYEKVVQAIESLLANDTKITLQNIRVELGQTGSLTTIHKYYTKWKNEKFLSEADPNKLSDKIKNSLTEKFQDKLNDQKFISEQTRKRNLELEQKLENLVKQNESLIFDKQKLENELTNKNNEIFKINLELKTQIRILEEVRAEHKSHIKFLEDNVERISNLAGQEFNNWREQHNNLYEKHQKMVIDFENQIAKLKQSDLDKDRERSSAMDNLIREVGKLKRQIAEKDKHILSLEDQ